MAKKLKKVQGFAMHFGHYEEAYPSVIFIRSLTGGFATVEEGLKDLAAYFLEAYFYGDSNLYGGEDVEDFINHLKEIPTHRASASPSFLSYHWNQERWWAWDCVYSLLPYLDKFYENVDEPMEKILPLFLDPTTIKEKNFRNSVKDLQKAPKDEWGLAQYKRSMSPRHQFLPLKVKK